MRATLVAGGTPIPDAQVRALGLLRGHTLPGRVPRRWVAEVLVLVRFELFVPPTFLTDPNFFTDVWPYFL